MYETLFYYAYNALESTSLAEEAVQEAFRIACSKPELLLKSKNPQGWMMNAQKHVVSNIKRVRSRMNRVISQPLSTDAPTLEPSAADDYSEIEYSDLLAPEEFELLKQVAVENRSVRDVAREMGISVETCKKKVYRAKKKLEKILKEIY